MTSSSVLIAGLLREPPPLIRGIPSASRNSGAQGFLGNIAENSANFNKGAPDIGGKGG